MSDNQVEDGGTIISRETFEKVCKSACRLFIPSAQSANDDIILYRRIIIILCETLNIENAKRKILDQENLTANEYRRITNKIVEDSNNPSFDAGLIASRFISDTIG